MQCTGKRDLKHPSSAVFRAAEMLTRLRMKTSIPVHKAATERLYFTFMTAHMKLEFHAKREREIISAVAISHNKEGKKGQM